jgi:hypothetical protein
MSNSQPNVIGEYRLVSPGVISPIGQSINILTGSWSQTRQIGSFTIKESGSYTPIQKVILNSRPSVELLVPNTNLSDLLGDALNFNSADPGFSFYTVAGLGSNFTYVSGSVPGSNSGVYYSTNPEVTIRTKGKIAVPSADGVPTFVTSSCLWISGSSTVGSSRFVNIFIPSLNNIYQTISVSFATRDKNASSGTTNTTITLYDAGNGNVLKQSTTSTVENFVTVAYNGVPNVNGITMNIAIEPGPPIFDLFVDNISVVGTFKKSDIQDFEKGSMQHIASLHQSYGGAKLTGPAVNVNTDQTVDGGPVVKVTKVSSNQLTFSDKQITTIDQTISGIKTRKVSDNIRGNISGTI